MDRSVVFVPREPVLPGGIILNALCLLAICGYLGTILYVHSALQEPPDSLCLLERTGIILTGMGFMKNLRHGVKSAHYGVALLGALATGAIALRHMSLHVLPGQQADGPMLLGLHFYTLSALFALLAVTIIAVLLGVKSAEYPATLLLLQSAEAPDRPYRRPWGRILTCLLFMLTVGANLVSMTNQCGGTGCNEELIDALQLR
ncbi:disulfide bond formation protein B [Herbaspirillum sp. NPDC087042]|uniref:disulfide bond formation protein B n=1 Tax=Herbaspirillum sp. NPDC087042 TaxID=3364004 RepID=UPI00382B89F8